VVLAGGGRGAPPPGSSVGFAHMAGAFFFPSADVGRRYFKI
jgi:hypothetical protein